MRTGSRFPRHAPGAGAIPFKPASVPPTASLATPPGVSRLPRPLQAHNPLLSPPFAQVANSDIPLNAQRTLIETDSGTLTSDNWPIVDSKKAPSTQGFPPASRNIDLIPVSSFNGTNVETSDNNSFRVRRLSRPASSADIGALLKIYPDAHDAIFGTDEAVPAVPAVPKVIPQHLKESPSLNALRSRVMKATEPIMPSSVTPPSKIPKSTKSSRNLRSGIKPPSKTPNSTRSLKDRTSSIKINPIRSIQPPRDLGQTTHQVIAANSRSNVNTGKDSIEYMQSTVSASESKRTVSNLTTVPNACEQSVQADRESTETHAASFASSKGKQPMDFKIPRKPVANPIFPIAMSSSTSMDLNASSSNENHSAKLHAFSQSTPCLPFTPRSYDTAHNQDPFKPRATQTATFNATLGSLGHEMPQAPNSDEESVPPVTPSPPEDMPTGTKEDPSKPEKIVRAKRSIRDLFKSRIKLTENIPPLPPFPTDLPPPPPTFTAKQGFIETTRSSLAKVMRDPRSRSRIHLPPDYPRPRPLDGFKFESACASPPRDIAPDIRLESHQVIMNLLESLEGEPQDEAHRLRHKNIAECIAIATEHARKAKMCAIEAKKNNRDAEMHADRAGLQISLLYDLLRDASPGKEAVRAATQRMHRIISGGRPEAFLK